MIKKISTIILILLIFSTIKVFAQNNIKKQHQTIIINNSNQYQIINKNNPNIQIHLNNNSGSTGYHWYLFNYNKNYLQLLGSNIIKINNTKKILGMPNIQSFNFILKNNAFLAPMLLEITFVYIRPWLLKSSHVEQLLKSEKHTFYILTDNNLDK